MGTTSLCEALKVNTTLTKLNIGCMDIYRILLYAKITFILYNCSTGNMITAVGAQALCEVLKSNTTLTDLKLNGKDQDASFH